MIQKNFLWEQERKNKRRKKMRAMGRSLRSMDSPTASDLVKRGNGCLRADPVDESLPGLILLSVDFCGYL